MGTLLIFVENNMPWNLRNKTVSAFALMQQEYCTACNSLLLTGKVRLELQCKTPGCYKERYKNEQGVYYNYCGKSCRDSRGKHMASGKETCRNAIAILFQP